MLNQFLKDIIALIKKSDEAVNKPNRAITINRILKAFLVVKHSEKGKNYPELAKRFENYKLIDLFNALWNVIGEPANLINVFKGYQENDILKQIDAIFPSLFSEKESVDCHINYNDYKSKCEEQKIKPVDSTLFDQCIDSVVYRNKRMMQDESNKVIDECVVKLYNVFSKIDIIERFCTECYNNDNSTFTEEYDHIAFKYGRIKDKTIKNNTNAWMYQQISNINPIDIAEKIENSKTSIVYDINGNIKDVSPIRETNGWIESGFIYDYFVRSMDYIDIKNDNSRKLLIIFPSVDFIKKWNNDSRVRGINTTFILSRESQEQLLSVCLSHPSYGANLNSNIELKPPTERAVADLKNFSDILYFRYKNTKQHIKKRKAEPRFSDNTVKNKPEIYDFDIKSTLDQYIAKEAMKKNIYVIDADKELCSMLKSCSELFVKELNMLPTRIGTNPKVKSIAYIKKISDDSSINNQLTGCFSWNYDNNKGFYLENSKAVSANYYRLFFKADSLRIKFRYYRDNNKNRRNSAKTYNWSDSVTIHYTVTSGKHKRVTAYLTDDNEKCIDITKRQKQLPEDKIVEWLNSYPLSDNMVRSIALKKINKKEKSELSIREVWLKSGAPSYCFDTVMSSIGDLMVNSTPDMLESAILALGAENDKCTVMTQKLDRFYNEISAMGLFDGNPFDELYEAKKKESKFISAAKRALIRSHLSIDEINKMKISEQIRRIFNG